MRRSGQTGRRRPREKVGPTVPVAGIVPVVMNPKDPRCRLRRFLNRCHRFKCFVYGVCYSGDDGSINVAVRPRKGSAAVCSGCQGEPGPSGDTPLPVRPAGSSTSGCTRALRIAPRDRIKKFARSLLVWPTRELILNWFRAKEEISAAAVEGLNANANSLSEKRAGFAPSKSSKPPCIMNSAGYPSPQRSPTDSVEGAKSETWLRNKRKYPGSQKRVSARST